MVNVNLTLLVELGLFLVFLLLMHRLVLRPLMDLLDRRDAQVEGDLAAAQDVTAKADAMEAALRTEITNLHRKASKEIVKVHREAQEEHAAVVANLKHREARELIAIHDAFMAQLDVERAHLPELATGISTAIRQRLGLSGGQQ
jgi:F-type H+-transporting ATPase subunit b